MATTLANISIKDNSSWNTYLNLIYPVGSIYIAYTSTSPATRFGGTWSQITSRFLYCTTGIGTGGSNTHTLTIDEMPSHNHEPLLTNLGSISSGFAFIGSNANGGYGFANYINVSGGGSPQQHALLSRSLLLEENCLDCIEWVI